MIVMKFGGTSVEDAAAIRRLVEIVQRSFGKRPFVVVSACSGVTDGLINVARTAYGREKDGAIKILDALQNRHHKIVKDLLYPPPSERVLQSIDDLFSELRNLVQGVYLLGELTTRSLDTFASYGERLSSLIVGAAFEQEGLPSELVDARKVMITDAQFGSAVPLMEKIEQRAKEIFLPIFSSGKIALTQGFIGATEDGATTTIGRGGSDFSAAIFGAAMRAEEIQIWTDVDGMMSADPRVVPDAKIVRTIGFDEASELAYFGAKVLHPNTIVPAMERDIPVRVLNSLRHEFTGTLILRRPAADVSTVVKSIASKKGIIIVNVTSYRMLLAHGFLARIFTIFAEHKKSVDVVATSEVSVSLTVDSEDGIAEIQKELEEIGEIKIHRQKAIICVVGEGMKRTPGVAARIFSALAKANVNVEMVSEGASEINLTLVVDERNADTAVKVLHKEFYNHDPVAIHKN